jgi:hypothetical protein
MYRILPKERGKDMPSKPEVIEFSPDAPIKSCGLCDTVGISCDSNKTAQAVPKDASGADAFIWKSPRPGSPGWTVKFEGPLPVRYRPTILRAGLVMSKELPQRIADPVRWMFNSRPRDDYSEIAGQTCFRTAQHTRTVLGHLGAMGLYPAHFGSAATALVKN